MLKHPAASFLARPPALVIAAAALSACTGGGLRDGAGMAQLAPASGAPLVDCAKLAAHAYPSLSITSAALSPAGATVSIDGVTYTLPENCYVRGKMNQRTSAVDGQPYAIGFEMRLPRDWNGRFFFQPNGGNEGTLATPDRQAYGRIMGGSPSTIGLNMGFAVLSSDSGHDGAANTAVAPPIRGQVFGLDPQARTDYAYQYVSTLTPMAKGLIKAAYGKAPDRSYMVSCSNGGRVGMVTAARFPEMFDGILAGAPAFNLPKAVVAAIWDGQAMAAASPLVGGKADISNSLTQGDMNLVASAVLGKCDALDGVTDGMVFDRAQCQARFKLATDVPACASEPDGSCLTAAKKTALDKIFSGPRNSTGAALYSDWSYDPGIAAPGWRTWKMGATSNPAGPASATNPTSFIMLLTGPSMAYIFATPPASPALVSGLGSTLYDYVMSFNMDTDAPKIFATQGAYTESGMAELTPPNPTRLDALRRRGAKMIVYHGAADPVFSINDTLAWYAGLSAQQGGDASGFARMFPVPGMTHCSGGPSADKFDMLSALVNWVEQGRAPESVAAAVRPAALNPGINPAWPERRTRLLCPHPKLAKYKGSGDTEDAANYSCQ